MNTTIQLFHGTDTSAIVFGSDVVEYSRKIHRYESESDYSTLKTELLTYGIAAAKQVFGYLKARRR